MTKRITIQDIADLAGVAKSTVSRYLNDGYVSIEKVERIDKAIRETGYRANFFASRLKTKSTKLIGIVMSRVDSFSAGKLLTGISSVMEEEGYQPLILISGLDPVKELSHMHQLIQQGVDGMIVQSVGITGEHLNIVREANIPIVFTGQSRQGTTYVKVNDKQAGTLMGEYIAKLHHKNVVYLGVSPADVAVGVDRYQGFVEGYKKFSPDGRFEFVETDFSQETAYLRGAQVMEHKPTAVVCATDNIALGMLRYCVEHGVSIPQEISLTGFGGYAIGEVVNPPLTTMAFDYKNLGVKTANKLLEMLKGNEVVSELDLNMELLVRQSTRDVEA